MVLAERGSPTSTEQLLWQQIRGRRVGSPFAAPVLQTPMGAAASPRLLKVGEVAERLGVSTATVYALCKRGELRHVRVGSVLAADEKEVLMKMNRSRSAAPDRPNRFLRSLATTAWTIGTSAVAGALSGRVRERLVFGQVGGRGRTPTPVYFCLHSARWSDPHPRFVDPGRGHQDRLRGELHSPCRHATASPL